MTQMPSAEYRTVAMPVETVPFETVPCDAWPCDTGPPAAGPWAAGPSGTDPGASLTCPTEGRVTMPRWTGTSIAHG